MNHRLIKTKPQHIKQKQNLKKRIITSYNATAPFNNDRTTKCKGAL